jgi:sporulation protein YlmC with PRC-barrel domain
MKDIRRAQDLIGNEVYDRHGDRIGRVDNVYIDDATDQPEWVTVRRGLLRTRESFIPLAGASQGGGGISVCVSKTKVKRAPQVDADDGHLSNKEGHALYRHYGIQRGVGRPQQPNVEQNSTEKPNPTAMSGQSGPPPPSQEEQTMPGGITLEPPDERS